jgi:CubicO group peptidase (beta-lactamase class C family)
VGHLLTHRSGLPLTPTPVPYEQLGNLDLTLQAIYELEPVSEPGGPVNYSPALNHALMGEILRRISGDAISMRDLMRRDLFEPLGMTSTALGAPRVWADRLVPLKARFTAAGWLTEHDVEVLNDVITEEAEMPWVGGVTTAQDVFRLAEMLRRGGEYEGVRYIAPAVLDIATRNQTGDAPNELYGRLAAQNGWEVTPAFIGLGFMLAGETLAPAMYGTYTSPRTFGNYGAGSTIFWVDPERDLTLVVLTAGVLAHAPNVMRFHRLSDMAVAAAV